MRKRPLLLLPAATLPFVIGSSASNSASASGSGTPALINDGIAWPGALSINGQAVELVHSDVEENDLNDAIDTFDDSTEPATKNPFSSPRMIASPSRRSIPPIPELTRSQSRASQELFNSLLQSSSQHRVRADSRVEPGIPVALSSSTASTVTANSAQGSGHEPPKDFVSFFCGIDVQLRRRICSFLELEEYNNFFPEHPDSRTPALAWVSPQISQSLLAIRADVFNDLDRQCTETFLDSYRSPEAISDNVAYCLYEQLIVAEQFKNHYAVINQLVYTFHWILKRLISEKKFLAGMDDLVGWILIATIAAPINTPESKFHVVEDFRRLRTGLFEVAIRANLKFVDKLLQKIVEVVAEHEHVDTMSKILLFTADASLEQLGRRLGIDWLKDKVHLQRAIDDYNRDELQRHQQAQEEEQKRKARRRRRNQLKKLKKRNKANAPTAIQTSSVNVWTAVSIVGVPIGTIILVVLLMYLSGAFR